MEPGNEWLPGFFYLSGAHSSAATASRWSAARAF